MMNLSAICERSDAIALELRDLSNRPDLTDTELDRLLFLRTQFARLNPPDRFCWVNARPVIDMAKEISFLERVT